MEVSNPGFVSTSSNLQKKGGVPPSTVKRNTSKQTNDTRKSPQLDFCAPGVAPAVYFSPMAEER